MYRKQLFHILFLLAATLSFLSCNDEDSAYLNGTPPGFPVSASPAKIPLPDFSPRTPYKALVQSGIAIVRPDDPEQLKIYLDVHRPDSSKRFPTLVVATAYRREFIGILSADFVPKGYAVVIIDVLGSGSSEGGWEALSYKENEYVAWIIDNWIPKQEWSNGKAGMFGQSYMGITSYLTAGQQPEHLKAIFPVVSLADAYRDIFFQGGIFEQEFILAWARGTINMSLLPPTQLYSPRLDDLQHFFDDLDSGVKALKEHKQQEPIIISWLARSTDELFFDERSPMTYWEELAEIPIFATGGWWDIFTRGSLLNYTGITKEKQKLRQAGGLAGPMRIIVGPWYHGTGAMMAGIPQALLQQRWFDWHLKADGDPKYDILDPSAPVILYVFGAEQWRREKEWPLLRAQNKTLYLSGQEQSHDQNESLNNASLLWPEEWEHLQETTYVEGPSRISHNPDEGPEGLAGTQTRSSCRWSAGATSFLPFTEDERENEKKVLTFSTARLDQDLEVTGPIVLRLWARSVFGTPSSPPPAYWFETGEMANADLYPLLPWAQKNDVHWTVNLNDVFPDGRSRNITSGWLSASHRPDPSRPDWTQADYDPFLYPEDQNPVPPQSGVIYEYVIEIWPTSNIFLTGHQIRIDIATSDYPHFLPSLVPSENEVLHDAAHPSKLIIPVVEAASTDPRQWIDDPDAFFRGKKETWTDY